MKKLIIATFIFLTITTIASQKLNTEPTLAADDNGYSDGPTCDGQGGGAHCSDSESAQFVDECDLNHTGVVQHRDSAGRLVPITYDRSSCGSSAHGCIVLTCGTPSVICQLDEPQSSATTPSSLPSSQKVNTYVSCDYVSLQWQGNNVTGCSTQPKVYRKEVGSTSEVQLTPPQLTCTVGGCTDHNVVPGKRYQYRVELPNSSALCQQPTLQDPDPILIPACASADPATPNQPITNSSPTTTNPTTPTTSNTPTGGSRYVCHVVPTGPTSSAGKQQQLETLKCEYVN